MAKYYPINLNLEGKICVVIGAGSVAQRKVKRLVNCKAKVKVISPEISSGLEKLAKDKKIIVIKKQVSLKDLAGAYLVICATDDKKTNLLVSRYCKKQNILVNVVDSPDECNFIVPSVVTRGDLTISISTAGASPALSKKIRQDLEKKYGPEYAKLLKKMKKLRPSIIKKIKNPKTRKNLFNEIIRRGGPCVLPNNKI